jgi:hypothetical protein
MSATEKQKEKSFNRFLKLPDPTAQPNPTAAADNAPHFRFRLIRESVPGTPNIDDLWAVVYLSHNNNRIRRANPKITPEIRFGLYGLWYESNRNSILLLERIPADKHGISIIGSTVILPLQQANFSLIESGGLPVVKLDQDRICGAGKAFDVLLFDTWVMHEDYQDFERSFFSGWKKHHGYGNLLPLRHLAMFWRPSEKTPLRVYAEPDSISMNRLLDRIGFASASKTAIGQPLLQMRYPLHGKSTAEAMLDRVRTDLVVRKIEQCASWPLA